MNQGKPLHQWEYAGKVPDSELEAGRDKFHCTRCGFALVSYTHKPIVHQIQRLINENNNLKRCELDEC